MSYTRQEQEANFVRQFSLLGREGFMLEDGIPSEEQRLTHFSHQQFDDDRNYPLQRHDYVDILPENPAFPGADGLRLVLETEFVYSPDPIINQVTGQVRRQPPIVVKSYSTSNVYGGVNSSTNETRAFHDSLNTVEREIHSDPPTGYIEAAVAEREEEQRPATPDLEVDLGSEIRQRLGEADVLLVDLTSLRENIIRTTPGVDARRDREAEAIRDRYGVEILSVTLGNPQRPETIIQYSFQDARALAPARAAITGLISEEITDRWTNITEIFNSGEGIPEANYVEEYDEVDYRAPEGSTGGTQPGELVRWPQEAEIERLIHYYNESQADLDGGQTARQISPEYAAYGISMITIRRSPISEAWDHVESINVVYEEPNRYTGSQQTSKTFIPENRIRIPSRATSQAHRNDVVMARLEEELIEIDVLIIELDELSMADDPLEAGILKKVREIIGKLDNIVSRANREPDGEARASIISKVEEQRELVEPHKILGEQLQAQLQELYDESDKEIQEILGKKQSILATKRFIIVDSKQRSLEFKLPIKKNDKSIQVLVIKKFLGLPFSSGDIFDEETKKRLQKWQQDNSKDILGLEPGEGEYTTDFHDPHFVESPLWITQRGRVDTLSYIIMKRQGLASAVAEVLDELGDIQGSIRGTAADPLAILGEREPGDVKSDPWEDPDYYYCTWFSNATRRDINSTREGSYENFLRKQSEIALREGTEKIFDHYGKYTSWVVKGSKSSHNVYAPVLYYQNRIETTAIPKDKEYTLTIKQQPLAVNVALAGQDTPVDVLFGQDLKEGAWTIFASIHKIHSPTRRPNSKFKFTIRVNKKMLDQVTYPPGPTQAMTLGALIGEIRETGKRIIEAVSAADEMAEELASAAHDRANDAIDAVNNAGKAVTEGIDWVSENKTEAVKKGVGAAFGMAKKYARDAEAEALKQLSGFGDRVSRKQERAFQAALASMDIRRESLPSTVTYEPRYMEDKIEKIRDLFLKYSADLWTWRIKGGRMRPQIDFKKEADNLKEAFTALKTILRANGYSNPKMGDEIEITFEEVLMERKVSKKPLKTVEDRAGVVPVMITYKKPGEFEVQKILQRATKNMHKKHPWNNPRTMNYLMNLDDLYKAAIEDARICLEDFEELLGAPRENMFEVIQQFTTPYVIILKANAKSQINLPSEAKFFGPIKRWQDKANEDWNLDGKNPKSTLFRDGMIRFEKGKTYSIIDPIPKEDLCTLEELYQEFLDKFDFAALFCSYASCIPAIPWPIKFDWDFDWKMPPMPKMPRWDPLRILIPMIEAALLEMLIAFLCGLVRGILDLIKFPSCSDLLDYGASLWDDAWGKKEGTDKKLLVMKDAANALDEMDLPVESYSDLADLFDTLAKALTPPEMCSLLEGEADIETLIIVKELMEKHYSGLSEHLKNESLIAEFFGLLGRFIDPELCAKLSNSANVVVGDLCPDIESPTLRDQLLSQNATPEEVSRAIVDSEKRRAALKELMENNPLDSLLEKMNLPGPYDTDSSNKMASLAIESVVRNIAIVFKNDLSFFVPSLFEMETSQKVPGDPGYNPVEGGRYQFVTNHIKSTLPRVQSVTKIREAVAALSTAGASGVRNLSTLVNSLSDYNDTVGLDLVNPDTGARENLYHYEWETYEIIGTTQRIGRFKTAEGEAADINDANQLGFTIGRKGNGFAIYWKGANILKTGSGAWANDNAGRAAAIAKMEEVIAQETADVQRIPKPGRMDVTRVAGYKVVTFEQLQTGTGADKEPAFFDLSDPSDSALMQDILTFPMRNLKDEVKPSPVLRSILEQEQLQEIQERFVKFELPSEKDMIYQENYFEGEDIRDCFSLERPSRLFFNLGEPEMLWENKTYNGYLSEETINTRLLARDISRQEGPKHLRSGAFSEMFLSSWSNTLQRVYPNMGQGGRLDLARRVNGHGNSLWNKLNGGLGKSVTHPQDSYRVTANMLLDKVGEGIRNSRYFDVEQIKDLADRISAEFIPVSEDEQVVCYARNRNVISFKKMRQEIMDKYKEMLDLPENDPIKRDFSSSGPLENSMTSQLTYVYVKTYIIEFMLKGLYVFSRFGAGMLSGEPIVNDYLKSYLISSLKADLTLDELSKEVFESEILKLANRTDLDRAVSVLIDSVLDEEEIIEAANKIFKPRCNSFKEDFFNELTSNIRAVQSLEHITPSRYENRGYRRGMVPLHSSFGGVYEDPEDLSQPTFFLEKYFRFSENVINTHISPRQPSFGIPGDAPPRSVVQKMIDADPDFEISIEAYKGVFNQYELNELLKLFSDHIDRSMNLEGPALEAWRTTYPDEIEFVDSMYTLGNLKVGLRLVFVPSTEEYSQRAMERIDPDPSLKPINETDIFGNGGIDSEEFWAPDMIEQFQIDPELIPGSELSPAEIQALFLQGRGLEAQAAINAVAEGARQWGLINNLKTLNMSLHGLTTKTRSYIADTNPRFGYIRGPRIIEEDLYIVERDESGEDVISEMNRQTQDPIRWKTDPAYAMGTSHLVKMEETATYSANDEGVVTREVTDSEQVGIMTAGKPQNIMFPTPLVEVELDYCPKELAQMLLTIDNPRQMRPEYHRTDDVLAAAMFGLGRKQEITVGDDRQHIRRIEASPDSKIEYLFDFIFPLDRYQALFMIYNQVILDPDQELSTMMDPTRGAVRRLVLGLKNPAGSTDLSAAPPGDLFNILNSDQTSFGFGNIADKIMADFAKIAWKMVKNTIPSLVRGGAAALDPAYKDMKKVWDADPAKVRSGLNMSSLSHDLLFSPTGDSDPLVNGFAADKDYMPFNFQGPIDIGLAMGMLAAAVIPPGNVVGAAIATDQLATIYEHLENAVTGRGENRYGKFMTPVGLLGLSMPELSGERDRTRKRRGTKEFKICEEDHEDILTSEEENESAAAAAYAAKVEGLTGGD